MEEVFIFKQKTAYEIDVCGWNSDVCSSDLAFLYLCVFLSVCMWATVTFWLPKLAYRTILNSAICILGSKGKICCVPRFVPPCLAQTAVAVGAFVREEKD